MFGHALADLDDDVHVRLPRERDRPRERHVVLGDAVLQRREPEQVEVEVGRGVDELRGEVVRAEGVRRHREMCRVLLDAPGREDGDVGLVDRFACLLPGHAEQVGVGFGHTGNHFGIAERATGSGEGVALE